ncbi:hypothetical protein AX17_002755 [Amanita inopinata Kibby_2008]|nr:hypothetical protein AX17_002755 [Amanita inopinata Kibby_2008]
MADPAFTNSSKTSSSSPSPKRLHGPPNGNNNFHKSGGANNRRERAKELQNLSMKDLIDLVLANERKAEKSESQLKKIVIKYEERVQAEKEALEQAKEFRQKMTQNVLDSQQETMRARQDVEQYKLKLENAHLEIRRGIEVVKYLEDDKEEMERALQRTKDKARECREKSAIQLAREQGRWIGFEEGLQQGKLAVRLNEVHHLSADRIEGSSRERKALGMGMRRALTQGPDRSSPSTSQSSHGHEAPGERPRHSNEGARRQRSRARHNSLDQTRSSAAPAREAQPPTRRSSVGTIPVQANHAASSSQDEQQANSGAGPIQPVPAEALQTTRNDQGRSRPSRSTARPPIPPPEAFMQARSDGGRSDASRRSTRSGHDASHRERARHVESDAGHEKSGSNSSHESRRSSAPNNGGPSQSLRPSDDNHRQESASHPPSPPTVVPQRPIYMPMPAPPQGAVQSASSTSSYGQRSAALVPPLQQIVGPIPRRDHLADNLSEVSTSPASTMTGIDIVTFHDGGGDDSSSGRGSATVRDRGRGVLNELLPVIPENATPHARGGHGVGGLPNVVSSTFSANPAAPVPQWIGHPPPPNIVVQGPENGGAQRQNVMPPSLNADLLNPSYYRSDNGLRPAQSSHSMDSVHSRGSRRSSNSFEIQVIPPSQPTSPTYGAESTSENTHYLSPNSQPVPLPPIQPTVTVPDPSESPVLPVLPRIVPKSHPTQYGTPAVVPLDVRGGPSAPYSSQDRAVPHRPDRAGSAGSSTGSLRNARANSSAAGGNHATNMYEEAPTPPGFQYPMPLGASAGAGGGGAGAGGKRKAVTLPPESPSSSTSSSPHRNHHYPSAPAPTGGGGSGGGSTGGLYAGMGLGYVSGAGGGSGSGYSVKAGSSQQPAAVVPGQMAGGGGYQGSPYGNGSGGGGGGSGRRDLDEGDMSDNSFDSATKRNTEMNAHSAAYEKW